MDAKEMQKMTMWDYAAQYPDNFLIFVLLLSGAITSLAIRPTIVVRESKKKKEDDDV